MDKLPELIEYDSRSKPFVMISKETWNVIDIFTSCREAEKYLDKIGINVRASKYLSYVVLFQIKTLKQNIFGII